MANSTANAYAVAQTEIMLGIEASRGVAVSPQTSMKVRAPKYKFDQHMIPDESLQGSMVQVYDSVRGMRYDSHGWDCYPYLDNFAYFLMGELGSPDNLTAAPANTNITAGDGVAAGATVIDTDGSIAAGSFIVIGSGSTQETHETTAVTGTAAPYSVTLKYPLVYGQAGGTPVKGLTNHAFSLLNNSGSTGSQPPSFTIYDNDGEEWRQLTAAQLDQLTIKGNASGFADYTCSWFCNPFTTPTAPTPAFTSVPAVPSWTTQLLIGGRVVAYAETWEIDLKRGVKPVATTTGTPEYFLYFAGPLQATGKITVIEQSGAPELTEFLNTTTESFDFTLYDLASGFALNLHSSAAKFTSGDLERSKEEVSAQLDIQFLPTTTDALAGGVSPIKATVANGTTTAYAAA